MKTPLETRGSRANDGRSARLGNKQPDGTHAHRIAHVPRIRPLAMHVQAALPGRPLRAAVLDDWSVPQIPADDPLTGGLWPQDLGPVRKLAAEMTALALTDAGLREVAGTCRTGLIIASSVPGLGDQVREE